VGKRMNDRFCRMSHLLEFARPVRPLALSQRVESIELLQSRPAGGSGYRIIASLQLGENPAQEAPA